MNIPIFSFWNMVDMHKGYVCKIFKFGCLKDYKLIEQHKNNTSKIQNKVTCKGIEPQFYEELWKTLPNCNTSFLPQPQPHKNKPQN